MTRVEWRDKRERYTCSREREREGGGRKISSTCTLRQGTLLNHQTFPVFPFLFNICILPPSLPPSHFSPLSLTHVSALPHTPPCLLFSPPPPIPLPPPSPSSPPSLPPLSLQSPHGWPALSLLRERDFFLELLSTSHEPTTQHGIQSRYIVLDMCITIKQIQYTNIHVHVHVNAICTKYARTQCMHVQCTTCM